jgi:two-component system cell cycle response regulator CpdR
MPGMDGRELAARVREMRPAAKVLAMSGYAGDDGSVAGGAPVAFPLLRKPFTRRQLVTTVRSVLDRQ